MKPYFIAQRNKFKAKHKSPDAIRRTVFGEARKGLRGRPCVSYFDTCSKENTQKSSYLIVRVHFLCLKKMLWWFTSCAPDSRAEQHSRCFPASYRIFSVQIRCQLLWVLTCSLTEARMEEVVSVSDLSPLAAGITGATIAPFSCSTGCSGTGITIVNTKMQEKMK